jgi:F1F0 ATPase subunit 2
MMNEWAPLAAALVIGLATGVFYFGGLWLTLRSISRLRRPALAAAGSLAFRLSVALLVLYMFSKGDPGWIGLWLLGFLASRVLLVQLSGDRLQAAQGD